MNFFKANKTFFILIALFISIFSTLQFISCSATDNIESALNLIAKESTSIINLKEELLLYDGLDNEVIESKNDLIQLSKTEKIPLYKGLPRVRLVLITLFIICILQV